MAQEDSRSFWRYFFNNTGRIHRYPHDDLIVMYSKYIKANLVSLTNRERTIKCTFNFGRYKNHMATTNDDIPPQISGTTRAWKLISITYNHVSFSIGMANLSCYVVRIAKNSIVAIPLEMLIFACLSHFRPICFLWYLWKKEMCLLWHAKHYPKLCRKATHLSIHLLL